MPVASRVIATDLITKEPLINSELPATHSDSQGTGESTRASLESPDRLFQPIIQDNPAAASVTEVKLR